MLGLKINPRIALVIAHDLVATVAAIVASFYIRFEGIGVAERFQSILIFMPGFLIYAGGIYSLFHLYESKWRFASLPDLMNIVRAATVLAVSLLVLDYVLVAPNVLGAILLRQNHDRALLGSANRISERVANGLSLFPLYPHPEPRSVAGVESDACAWPRRGRRGPVAGHRKRRGHQDLAGRHPFTVRRGPRAEHPQRSRSRQVRLT